MAKQKIDKEKLRIHAGRNIKFLLDKLGVNYSDRGLLLQACCPCKHHSGDGNNRTAFSWRLDIQHWICWSHHCQEKYGSDVFGLVRSILDLPFHEIIDWVYNIFQNLKSSDLDCDMIIPHRNGNVIHIHKPLDETKIKFLQPDPIYLLKRGFNKQVLRDYQIGFWSRLGTFMHDRVVVPVRDHKGYLVGFTGRTIYPDEKWEEKQIMSKWLHGRYFDRWPIVGEFVTGSILFNLNKAKNHIGLDKIIYLVEGPLDGLKLEEAGVYNWIATLGVNFRAIHRSLLVNLGINKLGVAYDNDSAGLDGFEKVKKVVGSLFEIYYIHLPSKDPGLMTTKDIQEIFQCK